MSRRTVDFMVFHVCAAAGVWMGIETYRGANVAANCFGIALALIVASRHRPQWLGGRSAPADDESQP
jgi:hypothetical protein